MTKDKEYDLSMVAGEFVDVYRKNPGIIFIFDVRIYFRYLGLRGDLLLPRHCS